ncbi:DUF1963 domain-containing protein [Streptomyces sp. SID5473]|uniref:DUF1963 domain-containing protein n=2 Tax=Streptomyces TaxID=1883 RepID=I2N2X5_STRT9|nr:hypothetical protein B7R87_17675 [Streptomyces tsukubensis]EIF91372.1 hypothetical protein [Streptomyces tsukubensis NRRL18488]MYS62586.1 DUF1963 domain-containing protein [Streptomyces sp. SID5473]QKM68470.1 DUF1963 domain-containing protein [Streptomyces tsukubensis NRRL18488]TAI43790.1 DUF1963 domain-containing protein [Streptomyces tsukubensis]
MGAMTDERYSRLAAEHLPTDLAERWTALLRPCIRLHRSAQGERTVAVLGGTPELPAGVGWPEWQGHGPLSFIASVRCAELPREGLTEEFPHGGTLLFFFYDGRADADGAFVSVCEPESRAGAQVLYVPEGTPVFPADVPEGLEPYPRLDLTAVSELSAPDLWLPQVREALLGDGRPWPELRETPAEIRSFRRALMRLNDRVGHQLGGHAVPVQGPVEYEVANAEVGVERAWGDGLLDEEAGRWLVLAQFDSDGDADMVWGDEGALYWLIRPEDLTACRFDEARLVVQH